MKQTDMCAGIIRYKTANQHKKGKEEYDGEDENDKNNKKVDKNTNSWNFAAYSMGVIDIGSKAISKIRSKKEKEGALCEVAETIEIFI